MAARTSRLFWHGQSTRPGSSAGFEPASHSRRALEDGTISSGAPQAAALRFVGSPGEAGAASLMSRAGCCRSVAGRKIWTNWTRV